MNHQFLRIVQCLDGIHETAGPAKTKGHSVALLEKEAAKSGFEGLRRGCFSRWYLSAYVLKMPLRLRASNKMSYGY